MSEGQGAGLASVVNQDGWGGFGGAVGCWVCFLERRKGVRK